ncbi:hypothetical protein [Streptomyces sp. NPDC020817]|uniref:hypothetical protein n=1 Tax=Streptomyces sp. NPDC020817 TaxID=3365095 RepID=UPI00379E9994
MSELPPDLLRLRTIVTYLRGELGRAERALIIAVQQAAAALAAQRRSPPEPPAWLRVAVARARAREHRDKREKKDTFLSPDHLAVYAHIGAGKGAVSVSHWRR